MHDRLQILIVEDEQLICNFLSALLGGNGYHILTAKNGREAISLAASHSPDLILLDLGLPDKDGLQIIQEIRSWSDIPIIVVSARQEEKEKVLALDAGANDYVTKPFGNSELLARIRTAIRLHSRFASSHVDSVFRIGDLCVDDDRRQVRIAGRPVHLTPIEYKIVHFLSQNAGRVLTHDQIIRHVWGPYASDSQILRVNMANIRRKLEPNPADPMYILTEVGVGYRMADSRIDDVV